MKIIINYVDDLGEYVYTLDSNDQGNYEVFLKALSASVKNVEIQEDAFPAWSKLLINISGHEQRDAVRILFSKHYPHYWFGMSLK